MDSELGPPGEEGGITTTPSTANISIKRESIEHGDNDDEIHHNNHNTTGDDSGDLLDAVLTEPAAGASNSSATS